MSFVKTNVSLTKGQMQNLKKSLEKNSPINMRLSASQLKKQTGLLPMLVTKTQLNKIGKSRQMNKGMVLKMSKRQINAMRKDGGILPLLVAAGTAVVGAIAGFAATKALEAGEKALFGNQSGSKGSGIAPFGAGTIPTPILRQQGFGTIPTPILRQQGFGCQEICLACSGSGLAPFGTQVGGQIPRAFDPRFNPQIAAPQVSQSFLEGVTRAQPINRGSGNGSGLFPIGVRPRGQ